MSDSILQTADRALQILELLGQEAMTATEIQHKMNLNKSTIHRLMMTLLHRGFVERNEMTGIYQIGIKLVEMSSIRLNQIELKTEAYPYLRNMADKLGKSVQLAIMDGSEGVFIEKIEKYQSFHMYCQTGKRIPLYCSAVGKSLLMDWDNQDIIKLLSSVEMTPYTSNTKDNPREVLADIQQGRRQGFTIDNAEHELDVYCIAAPIVDYRGKIIAAASITGFDPKVFTQDGKTQQEEVIKTCRKISERLGYSGA